MNLDLLREIESLGGKAYKLRMKSYLEGKKMIKWEYKDGLLYVYNGNKSAVLKETGKGKVSISFEENGELVDVIDDSVENFCYWCKDLGDLVRAIQEGKISVQEMIQMLWG